MNAGGRIVLVAALPEAQSAIGDLGGRRALAVVVCIISYGIRSRARRADVSYRFLFMHASGSELAELAGLIEEGKLRVIIDKIYPFTKISEALAYVESGRAKGKVAVTNQRVDGSPDEVAGC